jgi:dephospho-CoA kinase
VVVTTSPEVQLERLLARGDVSAEDARARIAAQMPLSEKEARAVHLIRNDGDLDDLAAQVDRLLEALREAGGSRT